jgi:DNA-binding NtrC family response regulator
MAFKSGPDRVLFLPAIQPAAGQCHHRWEQTLDPCVLIVDDESLIRWALAETLGDHGFSVEQASTKAEALRLVAAHRKRFTTVLLDLRLPDSRDLQLLASLRSLMPDTPIILMTVDSAPFTIQEALQLGAFRVVQKPFEVADMVALVRRAH